jgi:hypothetical protein
MHEIHRRGEAPHGFSVKPEPVETPDIAGIGKAAMEDMRSGMEDQT